MATLSVTMSLTPGLYNDPLTLITQTWVVADHERAKDVLIGIAEAVSVAVKLEPKAVKIS
jgi:hypothetical protein